MSSGQILDSNQKLALQYFPTDLLPTSQQQYLGIPEVLTPNTTAQPLNSFALTSVNKAGLYMYCIQVNFIPTTWVNQSSSFNFYAVLNGGSVPQPGTMNDIDAVVLNQINSCCWTGLVYLNAGDSLAWRYLNDNGTTAYTNGVATIMWNYLGNTAQVGPY
jgi:hypothetical protein